MEAEIPWLWTPRLEVGAVLNGDEPEDPDIYIGRRHIHSSMMADHKRRLPADDSLGVRAFAYGNHPTLLERPHGKDFQSPAIGQAVITVHGKSRAWS